MGGEACNERGCPLIGRRRWAGPPSHLRLCLFRMEHYIQTRGYATAPEAPLIGDNVTADTTLTKRRGTENNSNWP